MKTAKSTTWSWAKLKWSLLILPTPTTSPERLTSKFVIFSTASTSVRFRTCTRRAQVRQWRRSTTRPLACLSMKRLTSSSTLSARSTRSTSKTTSWRIIMTSKGSFCWRHFVALITYKIRQRPLLRCSSSFLMPLSRPSMRSSKKLFRWAKRLRSCTSWLPTRFARSKRTLTTRIWLLTTSHLVAQFMPKWSCLERQLTWTLFATTRFMFMSFTKSSSSVPSKITSNSTTSCSASSRRGRRELTTCWL